MDNSLRNLSNATIFSTSSVALMKLSGYFQRVPNVGILVQGAYILLGIIFWLAATDKAIHANESMMSISTAFRIKIIPATLVLVLLVSFEYALGWSFLFIPKARPDATKITFVILIIFLVYLGMLYHHPTSNCGCGDWITFGRNLREKLRFSIIRNIFLIFITIELMRRNRKVMQ